MVTVTKSKPRCSAAPVAPGPLRTRPASDADAQWMLRQAREQQRLAQRQIERDGQIFDPILRKVVIYRETGSAAEERPE